MKKFAMLLLILACIIGCTGCFCGHQWIEADCLNPRTCPLCGKTEGQAIGHLMTEATCQAPQTCRLCGLTQGDPVGHGWMEATCDAPQTCQWCALTEGDPLGHSWEDATTEAPRTCIRCAATEGERIVTDQRFTTATNQVLFGLWTGETVITGEALNLEDYMEQVPVVVTVVFEEDGTVKQAFSLPDGEAFLAELIRITEERVYTRFEELDFTREEANDILVNTYGMTVSEFAADAWAEADLQGMLAVHNSDGVYFIAGDQLNLADTWEAEFTASPFSVEDTKLTVTDSEGNTLELIRAEQ